MMGPENAALEPVTLARTMVVEPRIMSLSERRSRVAEGSGAREQAPSSADKTARFTELGSALAIPIELIDLKRVTIPLPSSLGFVGHGVGTGCPKTPAAAYVFIVGRLAGPFNGSTPREGFRPGLLDWLDSAGAGCQPARRIPSFPTKPAECNRISRV